MVIAPVTPIVAAPPELISPKVGMEVENVVPANPLIHGPKNAPKAIPITVVPA